MSEIKGNAQFVNVDIDDRAALESALNGNTIRFQVSGRKIPEADAHDDCDEEEKGML